MALVASDQSHFLIKRALEIDLEPSPYMDVFGERAGVSTLLFMGRKSDTPITFAWTQSQSAYVEG
jgi:hypothetical protein